MDMTEALTLRDGFVGIVKLVVLLHVYHACTCHRKILIPRALDAFCRHRLSIYCATYQKNRLFSPHRFCVTFGEKGEGQYLFLGIVRLGAFLYFCTQKT